MTAAAKAASCWETLFAALKRCATQKQCDQICFGPQGQAGRYVINDELQATMARASKKQISRCARNYNPWMDVSL
jgi:hypothetical protein